MRNTAMMELKEQLRCVAKELPYGSSMGLGLATAMDLATNFIELEKKQITDAYDEGIHQELNEEISYSGETYYNETYKP